VLDAFSRRIVGWAMETHLRTELVLAALEMAIGQRRPGNVIHHSDQGTQLEGVGSTFGDDVPLAPSSFLLADLPSRHAIVGERLKA
jgi:hypothetical protein